MSIYLGQLPPAEIARLKAELAETLIAHFCYPRFYDYRTNSLRSRPVDRAKRQEVWLYLSSVDFTAWSRIDLLSPDFQHQIERLFIHFVQRNRNFFGEQGRKRMSDIRMLITTSAASVVQGLRGHLTGQRQNNPPFGSPRPVLSWTTTNATNRIERSWEQMAPAALLLQHQLQEVRGEPLTGLQGEARTPVPPPATPVQNATGAPAMPAGPSPSYAAALPRQANGSRSAQVAQASGSNGSYSSTNGFNGVAPEGYRSAPQQGGTATTSPARTPVPAESSTPAVGGRNPEIAIATVETPAVKAPAIVRGPEAVAPGGVQAIPTSPMPPVSSRPAVTPVQPNGASERLQPLTTVPPTPRVAPGQSGQAVQPATGPRPRTASSSAPLPPLTPQPSQPQQAQQASQAPVISSSREAAPAPVSGEDVAIFEQMRHQLIVWLRIEAVRSGKDISGLGPSQLLELLHQQENYDETRLQVVSTLLNLSNQVIKNGQASMLDYKQALMFHLIHTAR